LDVTPPKTANELFLRAATGLPVQRTPVWAMRQAGRWDPEFQRLRAGRDFYEFSDEPELAAAASLCPRRFGVDAIILFYDITTLAVAMGQPFTLVADVGPQPMKPIRTLSDVRALAARPDETAFRPVLETLRIVRRELADDLPVLAFAGAPYTLGVYQLGVGKDKSQAAAFARAQPEVWRALLERTTAATVGFLNALTDAGATAYQLFDSWAGALSAPEYAEWCQPYHQRIFADAPGLSIVFVKDGPLAAMAESGAKVVSLSKDHDLAAARSRYPHLAFQGNVDHELLIDGSPETVRSATEACLRAGAGDRHILNLDHGMDRRASVENFAAFVAAATSWRPPNR
jgi:uroporphyrinogen decarboxylase